MPSGQNSIILGRMSEPVVEVRSITKLFKAFKAVDSVSFEVYPSEILGIVGPNTASLDPDIADKVRKYLKQIKQEKKISILLTSHNMKEMEEVSDRIIFLLQDPAGQDW